MGTVVYVLGLVVQASLAHTEVGSSEFLHGGLWESGFDDLLLVEVVLVHGLHGAGHISQVDSQSWLRVGLDFLCLLGRERGMVGGDLGECLRAEADGVVASLDDGGIVLHIFGGILPGIGRAIVGKALFLEIMVMTSHVLFALLLIFGGLGGYLLPVVENFMSGGVLLRSIVSQLEVMGP